MISSYCRGDWPRDVNIGAQGAAKRKFPEFYSVTRDRNVVAGDI